MANLDDILGQAYMAFVREADKQKAVAVICDAIGDDADLKIAAGARLRDLNQLLGARGRRACYVSSVSFDLLAAALQG